MGNSCDNGWRCPFVGLDRMFDDFLRQKETSIPNDLTRMVSLRQSQTRRRIESNSIFEHTHYSKSKGINKSLLLRTTSVSGGGGGWRGGHAGSCQKPEDRMLFIRTKTGQQKDFEDSNRRIKVKDRHSQEEQKKQRRKRSDGPPFLQCLY